MGMALRLGRGRGEGEIFSGPVFYFVKRSVGSLPVSCLYDHVQEAFMRGTEKYAHETQLSKRVGAWQDKLEPLMRR